MKKKGENRVWKNTLSKTGKQKKIHQTQIGQQVILNEALNILHKVREWIEVGSAKLYRKELKEYFSDDDILLEKITSSLLILVSPYHIDSVGSTSGKQTKTRHKRINTIQSKVMPELNSDQVWRFIEVVVDLSVHFEVEKTLNFKKGVPNYSISYVCNLGEYLSNKLAREAHKAFFPEPILTKPIDWEWNPEDGIVGGYATFQFDMVRTGGIEADYSKYSQRVFDTINYIQSTPWRVVPEVLEAISRDLTLPKKEDFIKSIYPEDDGCRWDLNLKQPASIGLSEKEIEKIQAKRAVFSDKAELYRAEARDFESAMGKYRAVKLALSIAEEYIGKEIYFPHSFDFRGRIYPICVGLSPQGSDAVKAMLEYSRGEVLTKKGVEWSWAYLASLYGEDKLDFEDRVSLGKELIGADYKDADEPYQFLAHQLEMKKFLEDPSVEFKGRVHLDACNSGSQFTSAITGDLAGCKATNVIPTIKPDGGQDRQDAYLLVAAKALDLTILMIDSEREKIKKDISKGNEPDKAPYEALKVFKKLLEENGRKICKTPVMVSNYGGTAGGRAEIIWNMLRELGVERKWITQKNAALYSKVVGDSISGVLNGGKAFEGYIQKMNNLIAKGNAAVKWVTDDGFFVYHSKMKELKPKQVALMLPNARRKTVLLKRVFSDKLSLVKMKSAISPNYVHSLDAELLRKVAFRMMESGIVDSDWIHDSFGCHPNHVDLMLKITKEEFVEMVLRKPLEKLDLELRSQVKETKSNLRDLDEISIPYFGEIDIEKLLKSDWFFS